MTEIDFPTQPGIMLRCDAVLIQLAFIASLILSDWQL